MTGAMVAWECGRFDCLGKGEASTTENAAMDWRSHYVVNHHGTIAAGELRRAMGIMPAASPGLTR